MARSDHEVTGTATRSTSQVRRTGGIVLIVIELFFRLVIAGALLGVGATQMHAEGNRVRAAVAFASIPFLWGALVRLAILVWGLRFWARAKIAGYLVEQRHQVWLVRVGLARTIVRALYITFVGPLVGAAAGGLAVGFVVVPPSWGLYVGALCVPLGLLAVGWTLFVLLRLGPRGDLLVDMAARTLTLPADVGTPRSVASFDSVRTISTERDAALEVFRVVVRTDGIENFPLGSWSKIDAAEELAGWLRERVGLTAPSGQVDT